MFAVDRSRADRKRDVPEPALGDIGDECRRNFRRFAEIEQGSIALFDEPVEARGRGKAAAGELEVDGDEASEPRADARGGQARAA